MHANNYASFHYYIYFIIILDILTKTIIRYYITALIIKI